MNKVFPLALFLLVVVPVSVSAYFSPQEILQSLRLELEEFSARLSGTAQLGQVIGADGATDALSSVNITDYGAKGDGVTDNYAAITGAIAAAKSQGKAVFVPAGTFAYNGVIKIDSLTLYGEGDTSVLYSLNWDRSAIFMYGNNVAVKNLKLTGVTAPSRQAHWEATRISIFSATNFVVDHVTIEGSGAAGIQTAKAVNGGRITNNVVKNTLSDGIHMTDRASNIVVENNYVEGTGDDGIAVVSYQADGGYVSNITARNNTVKNIKWGRLMSVVGGKNVLYENNYLDTNLAKFACVYIAQELSYATYAAHDVMVRNNTIKNCGGSTTGHAAIMIYSDGYEPNTNITFTRNDIVQNGQIGFRVFNDNQNVVLDSNRVTGANPNYEIKTDAAEVTLVPYESGDVGQVTTVNGQCGSANGTVQYTAPATNLCTAGTASLVVTGTSSYTWTCAGVSGGTTASCQAPKGELPKPTLTLIANPTTVTAGQSSTLSWSASNVTSCTATNGWTGTKSTSGTSMVSPSATTTYVLTCIGGGGEVTASVTVLVQGTTVTGFKIGDRIKTTDKLNVRLEPSANSKRLGAQARGAIGTIVAGPVSDGRYTWWKVDYTTGADGWSVGLYLSR
jgi:parallel beta-helix repeat protein